MGSSAPSRVRVLSNPGRWRTGDNPFVKMLFESYGPEIELIPFSWKRAIVGRYDVLHIHWLEYVVRSDSRKAQPVKRVLFAALLLRLFLTRTPSIWTVHNESPHEGSSSRVEAFLLRAWSRSVTHRVFLTESARRAAGSPVRSSVILHGHYRPVLVHGATEPPTPDGQPRRVLHFGHIRPYKGIETLVDAVEQAWPESADRPFVEIVGRAKDSAYGETLAARLEGAERISLTLAFLSDEDLEMRIRESDLVVLPYTRMNNSGAALLALSVGRPILVPSSPTMQELQAEVGSEWVHLFDPPFSAPAVRDVVDAGSPSGTPSLKGRDWAPIGVAYSDLFARLGRRE